MKRLLYIIILQVSLVWQAQAQDSLYLFSYFVENGQDGLHFAYSTDGLTWKTLNEGNSFLMPEIGKDRLMRDPCIVQGADKRFHMVWTTGWWDKTIGYASSKDLICWSEQKAIPVMEHEVDAKNSWAPEVFYDEKFNRYLIFWATTIPNRHEGVASSKEERGLNHRIYYVTTSDFETFSDTKLFFNPTFNVIDASILEDKGQYYMFVKNENSQPTEKNIRVTKASNALGPYPIEVSSPITGDYWAEGPTSIRIGDYIYCYFDKYTSGKYGAVRSKDMENWEDVSDLLQFPKGARHGTVIKVSNEVLIKLLSFKN